MSSRTPQDLIEFISEAELRFPVAEWMVDGVLVWPIVRILILFDVMTEATARSDNEISRYKGARNKIARMIRSSVLRWRRDITDPEHDDEIRAADVIFLVCSSARSFKLEGRWYQPYSDSFIGYLEKFGLRSLVLETTSDFLYRFPRFRRSVLIQTKIHALSTLAFAVSQIRPPKNEVLPGFPVFLAELQQRFSYDRFSIRDLRRRVKQLLFHKWYFRGILAKVRPAVSINDGYYSLETMAFTMACRELGVTSIEIQHGVQGNHHLAYRRWQAIPASGYPVMPDLFWCWSNIEYDNIKEWTDQVSEIHRPVVGGNPCLEISTSKGSHPSTPIALERWGGSLARQGLTDTAGVNILFTLQASYLLPEFLIDAIRNSPKNWKWWFRVHPQYSEAGESVRTMIRQRGLTNCFVDEVSDLPLAFVLQRASVHVTEFSSSVLEAYSMNVPSVVINQKAADLFRQPISEGKVSIAYDEASLTRCIQESQLNGRQAIARSEPSGRLFERMIKELIVNKCRQHKTNASELSEVGTT